jgi:hypothetical protein
MEIRRRAARRPGAEVRIVAPEGVPDLVWDASGERLALRIEDSPSWREDGTHYDYEVFLTLADIERIRQAKPGAAQLT